MKIVNKLRALKIYHDAVFKTGPTSPGLVHGPVYGIYNDKQTVDVGFTNEQELATSHGKYK